MTELVPLLETSSDETELALLRTLAREEPSSAAMARTAAALGLGTSALTAAGSATAASAVTAIAKGSIWGPVLKALAIGVSSGLVVSAGAHGVFSEPEREVDSAPIAAAPVAAPQQAQKSGKIPTFAEPMPEPVIADEPKAASASPAPPAAEAPRAALREVRAPDPSRALADPPQRAETPAARATFAPLEAPVRARETASPPVPQAQSAAPAASETRKVASATPSVSIAEETRAIDRARQALAAGRAREALSELDRYQVQWPRGVFTSEVLVLRVEAKMKLGDRASAVREARALIDARPNSRYAARLRALIETSK